MSGSAKDRTVLTYGNFDEIVDYVLEQWSALAKTAISERGVFTVALSGGSTPVGLYKQLAQDSSHSWEGTHVFMVDERYVPYDNDDNNYQMINRTLLLHVPIPAKNIHPILTTENSSEASAEKYEDDLRAYFKLDKNEFPCFDLIILGIGEDGHTASLFPHTPVLNEEHRLVSAVSSEAIALQNRITLTLPVINNAENIIVLATGKNKAPAVKEILENRQCEMPAAMVKPERGRLTFLLDQQSASLLSANR